MKRDSKWYQYIWIILLVIALSFAFIFRSQLGYASLPFFFALIIATMIEPLIVFLQNKFHLNRTLASIISLFCALTVIVVIFTLVLVFGINQIWQFATQLPRSQQRLFTELNALITKARDFFPTLPPESVYYIETTFSNIFNTFQAFVTKVLNLILTWAASIPNLFIIIIITILSAYFMAKDRSTISKSIVNILPLSWQEDFKKASTKAMREIIGFIKGQLFLSFLTLILSSIFLGLFLKSPYWMILAVILAVLDMIPVLGPGLILIPWSIIALFFGDIGVFWITTILNILILVTRQSLQPKVLGNYTGIHPLLMLFSIYAGLMIFGVWGLFIGPIIVIVIRAFLSFLKRVQKGSRGF